VRDDRLPRIESDARQLETSLQTLEQRVALIEPPSMRLSLTLVDPRK
jgi:hypothetical protein